MSTLKDVATLACVDASTVSRALNNHPGVHAETKKRILKAVEQLSYRPNLLAKNLRQGKRHTIGIVVPRLHLSVFPRSPRPLRSLPVIKAMPLFCAVQPETLRWKKKD